MKSSDIHIRPISQEMPQQSTKIRLKITYIKFHLNFPGANELTHWPLGNLDEIGQFKEDVTPLHMQ